MLATLRRPRWLVAALVVVALAALFIRLGFWQLDRLEDRRARNEIAAARFSAEPVELSEAITTAGSDIESLRYQRVTTRGTFDRSNEVLIRSQTHLGQPGYHVITPLRREEGWAVLVNRGWVPLGMDRPPVEAPPPSGEVEIHGWLESSRSRPTLGAEDPPGERVVFSRVDIGRITEQLPYSLSPVYLVMLGTDTAGLPVPLRPPDFTDEGPHLGYAIQWFGFAAIGLVGFFFLLRRGALTGRSRPE